MKHLFTSYLALRGRTFLLWLLALLLPGLGMGRSLAPATPPPAAATQSLAGALNPNGTLKAGLSGSFNPAGYVLGRDAATGQPTFRPAQPAKAKGAAGILGAGDENWQDGFTMPGTNGRVSAIAVAANGDVYLGGSFTVAGGAAANNIARWNSSTSTWSALGTGLNSTVNALAVVGTDVYAGGNFSTAGGVAATYIAKWSSSSSTWSALGSGVSNYVYALAVMGTDVYAGGDFFTAGGVAASRVARWSSSTSTWSALGTGLGNTVQALAVVGSDVYVGGYFTTAGGAAANRVARWSSSSSTWSALGSGVNNAVNVLAVVGTDVYAGGVFTTAGGATASRVARWNSSSSTWSALGTGLNSTVNALAVVGTDVYAGGGFTTAGGAAANYVAKWSSSSSTWSTLGTGLNNTVYALAVVGTDVYAGGDFTTAGGVVANRVARWSSSSTWSALGTGLNGTVNALAVVGTDVYVGGSFTTAGGAAANNIAKWNSSSNTWSVLGAGLNNTVNALAVVGTDVYVGGRFTMAGGAAASRVARWNSSSSTWSALGTGLDATVQALAVVGTDVYAGGTFTTAGGATANRVARWNSSTSTWSALGTGLNNTGQVLAVSGSDVYVGGYFTTAGGVAANLIARWNSTTSTWSALGTGLSGSYSEFIPPHINALAVVGTDVYAGGVFTTAGGATANRVARWNSSTSTWSALGTGLNNAVSALAVVGTDVYVGGNCTTAGGAAVNNIARWSSSSSTWSALGTGLNNTVNALAVVGGKVLAGGTFTTVGDGSKVTAYFGAYTPPNTAPVVANQTFSLAENSAATTAVGTVQATDNPAQTLTYTLTAGNGSGAFALNSSTGALTVANAAPLNFEATPTFALTVQVSDNASPALSSTATITVNLTNVNEAPTALALSNSSVAENAGANATVGTFTSTDPDAGNTFTYALVSGTGDTDNGAFNLSGNTLRLTASANFEAKSSYAIRVQTQDQGGLSFAQTFTISITNENEAPGIGAQSRSVAENAGTGTAVGSALTATDPDAGTTLSYSITADNSAGRFAIDSSTGQLTVAGTLDYEATNTYSLTVQVSDGALSSSAPVTVNISNVNETPTALALSNSSVAENAGANAPVGTFSSTDPDAGNSFTYALVSGSGDTDNGAFNISGNTLRLTASADFETKNSYAIRVRTQDQGGLSFVQTFTISITNVSETPAITLVNPTSGLIGSSVTLTGTNLSGATAVTFTGTSGNVVSSGFSVNGAGTSISGVVVPAGATTGPVTVTTPDGTSNGQPFTLLTVPAITSFSPAGGAQGSTLTVTGTGLTGTASVRFGELPAAFVVNSNTQLTVTVPRGASTHKLHVTNAAGTTLSATAFSVSKPGGSSFPLVSAAFNNISVGTYSKPAFTDLDGDGLLDMLVGEEDGNLNHYEQSAANSTAFTLVTATFNNIVVTIVSAPTFTDLDGDGLLDMVVGQYADGALKRYEQSAVNSTAFVSAPLYLNAGGGWGATPTFTDLDGDGLLDLLVGEENGYLNHYEQDAADPITFNLVTNRFNGINHYMSVPTFTDLDGNGLLDMLVGTDSGSLTRYEQSAVNSTAFVPAPFDNISASAPAFTDLDGDGLLDMVVGQYNGTLSHYEQAPPTPTISGFTPPSGPVGTSVTLTGTNLANATGLTLNGTAVPLANITANTSTSLTFIVPASATSGPMTVTTATGTSAASGPMTVTPQLSNLVLSAGSLSPTFAGGTTSYTLTVPGTTTSTTLTPTNAQTSGGTITVNGTTVASGAASGSIALSPGSNTITIVVSPDAGAAPAATYTVTVTRTPCVVTATAQNISLALDASGNASTTAAAVNNGSSSTCGAVSLSLDKTSFTCADLGANPVTLTVTDAFGGSSTATATVTVTAPPTATLSGLSPNPATAGTTVTATGTNLSGATALTVNGVSASITGLTATGFTFVVPAGATSMGNVVVAAPCGQSVSVPFSTALPPTISSFALTSGPVGSSVVITGTNFTGATAVAFNGTAATYTVNSATEITATVPAGATSGPVSVTTPGGTATSTNSFTVTLPLALTGSQTNVTCFGQADGTATATVSEGTAPYTYSWNTSPVQTTASISGLAPGSYTVTVSDNAGAQLTRSFTITQPTALVLGGSQTAPTACATADGSATVTASGGTGTYTYSWNTTPVQTTATATGLPAGTYTVTVRDANSCTSTRSYTLSGDLTLPVAAAQDVTLTLDASGTATLAATAVDNGSTDNCGIATRTLSRYSFTCADVNPPVQPAVRRGSIQFTSAARQYVLSNTALSGTATGTLETWVKTTTVNGIFSALICSSTNGGDGGSGDFVTLRWDGNGRVACEGIWTVNQNGAALTDGQWHHVAAVGDGSTCKLYIDGVLNNTGSVNASQTFTNRRIMLGAERSRLAGVASYYTTMELDNSRVWNVARTAAQIQEGMSNEVPANTVGLQLAYAFNESPGSSTVRDASGNARTATLYGTALPTLTATGGALLVPRGVPVTLTVADAAGNSSPATAYATVQTGLPATALTLSTTVVPENVPVGTVVATLGLANSSPCASTTSTFTLVNAANTDYALFSLGTGSNANQLLINTVPDFETRTSYTVRLSATDQNNVTVDRTVTITVTDLIELSGTQTTTCGSTGGTATVTIAGTATGYAYSWSPAPGGGQGTATATGLAAATYTVTVSKTGLTSATRSFSITSDTFAPVAGAQDVALTLDASGTATLAATAVETGSTDNCGIASRTLSRYSFTCADVNPAQPAVRRGSIQFTSAARQYVLSNTALSGTATGTLETWVKTTTVNGIFSALICSSTNNGDGGSGNFVTLRWDGNGRVACEGIWTVNQNGAALTDGQWHHVAAVGDGSTCKLYIDGVLNNTGSVNASQTFTNRRIMLGAERSRLAGVASYYTTMELDNSRVWNVARTAAQIQEGMSNEVPANTVGLQLAYAFNEGAGSTVRDASGNARTATLYGTALPTLTATGGALLVPRGVPVTLTVADAAGNSNTATAYVLVQTPSAASTPLLTWTGGTSTDWNDCANWSYGLVPVASQSVTIPAGLSRYPALSNSLTVADLQIAANASLSLGTNTLSVTGNLTNAGPALTGTVILVGTGAQTVAGNFSRLVVNKSSGTASLSANASTSTSLNMTSGVLTTGSYVFTLIGNGANSLTETATSYVSGTLETTRNLTNRGTNYAFGGIGLTLTPGATGNLPGNTTVRRVTGTALTGVSGRQGILRSFDIQPTVNTGLNVTLVFGYRDAELNGIPEASLALFKSETGAADTWGRQRNVTLNATNNTATLAGVQGFSIWTLGNADAPLPVELTSFTAQAEGAAARLKWTTASEKNSARFEIERSADGKQFELIGEVAAQGTKASPTDYTFLDDQRPASPAGQLTYYRLRQVDQDGTAAYSLVRVVQAPAGLALAAQLAVYPTLAEAGQPVHYRYTGPALPAGTRLTLYDALGRAIGTAPATTGEGTLEVAKLPTGWYWLRVSTAAGSPVQARFYRP